MASNIGAVRDDDTLEICYDLKSMTCDSAIRLAGGPKGAKVKFIFYPQICTLALISPTNFLYGDAGFLIKTNDKTVFKF